MKHGRPSSPLVVMAIGSIVALFPFPALNLAHGEEPFLRGDGNSDGIISLSDYVYFKIQLIALANPPGVVPLANGFPRCPDTGDIDDDGALLRSRIRV